MEHEKDKVESYISHMRDEIKILKQMIENKQNGKGTDETWLFSLQNTTPVVQQLKADFCSFDLSKSKI